MPITRLLTVVVLPFLIFAGVGQSSSFGQSLDSTRSILEPSVDTPKTAEVQEASPAMAGANVFEETLPSPVAEITRRSDSATIDPELRSAPPVEGGLQRLDLRSELQDARSGRLLLPRLQTTEGYDVVLAGPVHEAFMIPYDKRSHRDIDVVAEAPPESVREKQGSGGSKFTGNNVEWISGYWAWQDDAAEYVWVSGMYRDCPPDRSWVAGYWSETTGGYRWTSGYWAAAVQANVSEADTQIAYLPSPPLQPVMEMSNTLPAADQDAFWIPANWEYEGGEYTLNSGYWTSQVDNWIWQPAYYVNAPQGYIFVSGYWDYEPQFRGQAFACVDFDNRALQQSGFTYKPTYPLSTSAASILHLFVREDTGRFYYGDFYADNFVDAGYRPWYLAVEEQAEMLPMLTYYDWKYRRYGFDFVDSMARYASHFRSIPSVRPSAQLNLNPQLALRDGIAGQVNADTFDQIVRGNVGGQPSSSLATASSQSLPGGLPQPQINPIQTASSQVPSAELRNDVRAGTPNSALNARERTAGYSTPLGSSRLPGLLQRAPAALNYGGQTLLVFPGGRIGLAPPGINPFLPPVPAVRIPGPPVGPLGALRPRGRR